MQFTKFGTILGRSFAILVSNVEFKEQTIICKKNNVGHVLAINMVSMLKLERPMPIELVAKSIWYDILVMKEDLKVGIHGIGNIDLPNVIIHLMSFIPYLTKVVGLW